MPVHDWTRVDAETFYDFHHGWISQIKRVLNSGLLPSDYYAMAEQITGGLGPVVDQRRPRISHDAGLSFAQRLCTVAARTDVSGRVGTDPVSVA